MEHALEIYIQYLFNKFLIKKIHLYLPFLSL